MQDRGVRHHRWLSWLMLAAPAMTALWLWGTHTPSPERYGLGIKMNDKIVHACGFAVLTACWWICLRVRFPRPSPIVLGVGLWIGAALFGGLDELTQPWFSRECDLMDWVADLGGATVAILLLSALIRKK